MGSDDLFHKRKAKAKTARDLARKSGNREARERVLIVCEGEKTEPYYLMEIRESLGLTNADIVICGKECGSDPLSIVDYALGRFKEDSGYDNVFCVFDKDSHATYKTAVDKIERKPGKRWCTIKSVPCFEFWVLLHFKETTKPFSGAGGLSPCDRILIEVRREFGEYHKGYRGLYKLVGDQTDKAISNAKATLNEAQKAGTDNPSTEMHILVEYLRDLKAQ
ncbi:MAG TPA: RloB domain-containing protein [Rhodospirillales bacterium]|nr:RloB domain-containing protein [Rhodospirillales bacterium]